MLSTYYRVVATLRVTSSADVSSYVPGFLMRFQAVSFQAVSSLLQLSHDDVILVVRSALLLAFVYLVVLEFVRFQWKRRMENCLVRSDKVLVGSLSVDKCKSL
jgi:hypothetical protein